MTASAPRTGGRGSARQVLAALQSVLAAEHAVVYGYGVVGAHLGSRARTRATADWVAHQRARDRLEEMLRALGARPVAADAAYRLPARVRTARDAVSLALTLEDRIAAAYLALVAISSPAIREFGALQLRASALRAALWRGSTVAFPGLPAVAHARHGQAG